MAPYSCDEKPHHILVLCWIELQFHRTKTGYLDSIKLLLLRRAADTHNMSPLEFAAMMRACVTTGVHDSLQDAFEKLNAEIVKLEAGHKKANRLFYLALPPSVFAPVTSNIKVCCMSTL